MVVKFFLDLVLMNFEIIFDLFSYLSVTGVGGGGWCLLSEYSVGDCMVINAVLSFIGLKFLLMFFGHSEVKEGLLGPHKKSGMLVRKFKLNP